MKCPKCDYLGFETGDRCKNCGYDFSLAVAAAVPQEPDLPLRDPEPIHRDADKWLNQLEARLDSVRPMAEPPAEADNVLPGARPSAPTVRQIAPRNTPALPLFHPGGSEWDEPLIKVPAAPRVPLSVRRTPEKPRLRTVAKQVKPVTTQAPPDPVLFAEEPLQVAPSRSGTGAAIASARAAAPELSRPIRRIVAAMIDYIILLSIDAAVVYFTLQIAGLSMTEWRSIPLAPLVLFLLMVKAAYFSVFTMVGGQTVGKMATGIRVVTDNDRDVEPSRAVQRALATLASLATAGIAFVPVLFSDDRRALHDRLAGTRVVGPLHE
jgi:uncharacterized RDD family membrane protein YckC